MLRLSGELPILDHSNPETACRNCCEKFSFFASGTRCYHCGYHYCRTCATQGWASWPDNPSQSHRVQVNYTVKNVCCFCVEFLTITSAGAAHLNSHFSQEDLLRYARAYNIVDPIQAGESSKVELISVITKLSKDGCNCLPLENERYYRQYSVPSNIPHSQMGFSTVTLQYTALLRPLCMSWGTNNPWVPPPRNNSSNLVAPVSRVERYSVSKHSPVAYSTSPSTSLIDSSSALCVVCQDEEAIIAIISCGCVQNLSLSDALYKIIWVLMSLSSIDTWHCAKVALTRL
ncbi:hypothetical protein CPB84DRAFT_1790833 [Gymnopilus junonius]|uniref:FYVE-type domain-containing protein n=1 Tax=Gymnopilus junonius TaxID=109634 RepID=A0A9P5NEV3_GYMJU|nr:hypothetical protein CPB84DRAFT_1790833 [Gymnopilus junonius]